MGLIPKRAGAILKEGYRREHQITGTGTAVCVSHDKNTKGRESEQPGRYNQSRKIDSSNKNSRTLFHLHGESMMRGIRLALVTVHIPLPQGVPPFGPLLVTVTTLGDARARRQHNAQSSLLNGESTQQIRLTSPPIDDLIHSARGIIAIRNTTRTSTIRLMRMTCRRLGLAGSLLRGALSSTSAGLDSALVAGLKGNQPMLNDHPPLDPMSEPYRSAGAVIRNWMPGRQLNLTSKQGNADPERRRGETRQQEESAEPIMACSGGYRHEAKQSRDGQK
ncbi:uncharacterized protein BO96DRAFT_462936 [Aspergillus niger CBS 101883]|uniref:Contig An02c0460, genomic contig n=2 Tax=Aspergillus niger TaxID=5061 RepID=A2QFC0_ASPNC|nr:uncharacterized protein BO96DRAFT_462936 [Aspergillus niger CBS 101883]XP_059605711.1 uncharacterized protein An02g14000 [Aspergillus niger]PYH60512.1 hypothetical protein BO96DRAFT_462936 [Aspergillus niger CBS 101883]CAK48831.1 unnamed protein product [Aspergillus niger]